MTIADYKAAAKELKEFSTWNYPIRKSVGCLTQMEVVGERIKELANAFRCKINLHFMWRL